MHPVCSEGSPHGVVAKEQSEFVLLSHYYVHFRTNTLGKYMDSSLSYGLNMTTFSIRMVQALNNLRSLLCDQRNQTRMFSC